VGIAKISDLTVAQAQHPAQGPMASQSRFAKKECDCDHGGFPLRVVTAPANEWRRPSPHSHLVAFSLGCTMGSDRSIALSDSRFRIHRLLL
jgi:hypothetical protein